MKGEEEFRYRIRTSKRKGVDKEGRIKFVNLFKNPIYNGKSRGVDINKRVVFPTLISVWS